MESLKVRYVAQDAGVTEEIAFIALIHARGNVVTATEMLSSDTFKAICGREAREVLGGKE